ncbi:hypothetical protein LEN26_018055 [Aphanomyces euteiches]|nr:hypothetical protein LEN26_018055 [Aphanomyces euteiches]
MSRPMACPSFHLLLVSLIALPLEALVIERPCCHVERHIAAKFGPFYPKDVTKLELVRVRPFDACGRIQNDLAGKFALIQRGNCNFAYKVLQAQDAHAKAVIVMDTEHRVNNTWVLQMVGDAGNSSRIVIPSVFVSHAIGLRLLERIEAMKLAGMSALVTVNATGQINIKDKSNDIAKQNIILVLFGIFTIVLAHWLRIGT